MTYATLLEAGINDPRELVAACLRRGMLAVRRNRESSLSQPRRVSEPVPGEIPFCQWVADEAARQSTTTRGIYMRYYRGGYPDLKLRRVNKRVVYVLL